MNWTLSNHEFGIIWSYVTDVYQGEKKKKKHDKDMNTYELNQKLCITLTPKSSRHLDPLFPCRLTIIQYHQIVKYATLVNLSLRVAFRWTNGHCCNYMFHNAWFLDSYISTKTGLSSDPRWKKRGFNWRQRMFPSQMPENYTFPIYHI